MKPSQGYQSIPTLAPTTVSVTSVELSALPHETVSVASNLPSAGVRLLSFNLWGIFAGRHNSERMKHFGTKVAQFDIICLQEQFHENDFRLILASVPAPLRDELHAKRFVSSSFIGCGLSIISKYEIISTHFTAFPTQGYAEKFYHGDFYANKGVALARVRIQKGPLAQGSVTASSMPLPPDSHRLQFHASGSFYGASPLRLAPDDSYDVLVYNTHLISQYERLSKLGSWEKEQYAPFRMSQAYFLARYITSTARIGDNIVVCGDFNCDMQSPEMKLFMAVCHMLGVELAKGLVTDDTNMTFTNDNEFNSSPTSYFKLLALEEDMPVQLDHIFFTPRTIGVMPFLDSPDVAPFHQRVCEDSCVGVVLFTNNKEVPTKNREFFPLSDHYGVGMRFAKSDVFGSTASVPTLLLVDVAQHRKAIEHGASFLTRSSICLRKQAHHCYALSLLCAVAPFIVQAFVSCDDARWFASMLHSTGMTMIFFCVAIVSLVLGKLQRIPDSLYMASQGEELAKLIA
jgi:endonuclease/exonuclease/phosphatase family metal-dependent hydrolase